MRNLILRKPAGLFWLFLGALLLATGCGNSDNDFVINSTNANTETATISASTTGALIFNFTQARAVEVPSATTLLLFQFFDNADNEVFSMETAFATSITISGVPTDAVRVEITALDNNDAPLVSVAQSVAVEADMTSTVDLTIANVTPITVNSLSVTPQNSAIGTGTSVTLIVHATYSNGTTLTLPNSALNFEADTLAVNVDQAGVVTGANFGLANVSASLGSNPSVVGVAQFSVSDLELEMIGSAPIVLVNGDGSSASMQVIFTEPDGTETNVTNSPNLLLEIAPDELTGLSIVPLGSTRFTVNAMQSNAIPGDILTVTATFTDLDGVIYVSTLEITVTTLVIGSPP